MNLTPGLHYGIPAKAYHADCCVEPSLSSTIARIILKDSVAHAHYYHPRLGGFQKPPTASMRLGSMVHSLMDEGGAKDYEVRDFDSYRGGEARLWRDSVIASGRQPMLESELEDANHIASALRAKAAGSDSHPFNPLGKSEVTAIWQEGDAYCRARFDRLIVHSSGSVDVFDWKTAVDVSDRAIIRSIVKFGYYIQVAFYLRGLVACLPSCADRTSFTMVFVESAAPYTVRRARLTPTFLEAGDRAAQEAIEKWQAAFRANDWSDPRQSEALEVEIPSYMEDADIEISPA